MLFISVFFYDQILVVHINHKDLTINFSINAYIIVVQMKPGPHMKRSPGGSYDLKITCLHNFCLNVFHKTNYICYAVVLIHSTL